MSKYQQQFFQLLRLGSQGGRQPESEQAQETIPLTAWRDLHETAVRQSLIGVCYRGICLLPADKKPPSDIVLQWAGEAEGISGMNRLQNQEAARLTRLFAEAGHQTAILKGQANARLYPDPLSRQPGDIDIWVEGGREKVMELLLRLNLIDERPSVKTIGKKNQATISYHHVHLPPTQDGVIVEVHFRPSSGNNNPQTNRRLQGWLEQEIQMRTMTEQGFCVPSTPFALVMQLSHIQRHFLGGGIGLRQICDYCLLLQSATDDERRKVSALLSRFGLRHTAGALMWVLAEVLHLDNGLMLCKADSYRGEWMLREIMTGGNFGRYAKHQQHGLWQRFFEGKRRNLQLMRFDFWEIFWAEVSYWKTIVRTLPARIRYRTLSLRDVQR
jgi:hypothetical protein